MGNTVGSRKSLVAFIARKQQTLWVQPRQLEILRGSILGDAYVSPLGKIQIEHSVKQSEYLAWKYQELASISYRGLPTHVPRYNRRVGKSYESIRFWTRQFFRSLRSQFYEGRRKIFPVNLQLTPLMLAVWYMDDGHYEKLKRRSILATDQFDQESLERVQSSLEDHFSIESVIRKNGKLVIARESLNSFFQVIGQHIVPSMHYKFVDPVTTDSISYRRVG